MWSPPLRESFGYPLCLSQVLVVTLTLRSKKAGDGRKRYFKVKLTDRHLCSNATNDQLAFQIGLLTLLTACFIMVWQFAQFVLFTQLCCLYGVFVLGLMSKEVFLEVLQGLWAGFAIALVFLFGNQMLLMSW